MENFHLPACTVNYVNPGLIILFELQFITVSLAISIVPSKARHFSSRRGTAGPESGPGVDSRLMIREALCILKVVDIVIVLI